MPKKGLEPPHPCEYVDLNHARLPIPPLRHETQNRLELPVRQHLQVSQMRLAVSTLAEALVDQEEPYTRINLDVPDTAHYPGVLTPFFNSAMDLVRRLARVSSFFASVIQRQYSLRWV